MVPPSPPGPSGAAPGNVLRRVEGNGFRDRLGGQAGSKANLPTAHPCFFPAVSAKLATPGRIGSPVLSTFPLTHSFEDFDFSVPVHENLRCLHGYDMTKMKSPTSPPQLMPFPRFHRPQSRGARLPRDASASPMNPAPRGALHPYKARRGGGTTPRPVASAPRVRHLTRRGCSNLPRVISSFILP